MSNTITAFFKGRAGVAESVYQYDYGKVLIIDGLSLPATFEVHFTTISEDNAITVIGQNNRVAIPDSCISIPGTVTAYIYLHTGDNDGETEYVIKFAVIRRARPDYDEDDKSDWESAASQALAMLQNSKKVNTPLDEYNQVDNGTDGQLLRTKGDGSTEWVDVGLPTDAQTAQAVSDWLDEHPEATTTVVDGSLTEAKFSNTLKLKTIKDYVTPEMFGAKGDGLTDDTDAFTAMVTEADYIFIPNKEYVITTVNVPAKDIWIDGVGTILVKGNGFVFNAPLKQKTIKNISFELDDTNGTCAMGFYGDSSDVPWNTLVIDNVKVNATSLSGKKGIDIQSENEALLSNIALHGCSLNVFNSINPSVVNGVFRHAHIGIHNANTDDDPDRYGYACGLKVMNSTILGCEIGIKSVQCDSIQIQSSMIDYNDYPIVILGTDEPVIENCFLSSRQGNTVIYVAPNNSGTGVFGGNGINTENANDCKISNCYVIQHNEALTNSAIVIKNGWSHIIDKVSVAYGGKACIELHDVTTTIVSDCSLRSTLGSSGAKALLSYKSGSLNDDSSNMYKGISTSLPIYVKNAQTDINTNSFVTKRFGTVIFGADETSKTINTYIPQGISYAFVYINGMTATYSEDGANLTITIPSHDSNKRVNWVAIGKGTSADFS